jgi:hypothetical protein
LMPHLQQCKVTNGGLDTIDRGSTSGPVVW